MKTNSYACEGINDIIKFIDTRKYPGVFLDVRHLLVILRTELEWLEWMEGEEKDEKEI